MARPSDGLRNLEARQSRHEEVRDHDLVDEWVEACQALVHVHDQVRLMTQQREKFGVDVPDERFIIDHEHLHAVINLVRVNVARAPGPAPWPVRRARPALMQDVPL